ncbi:MAG: glycosyltransferase [Acetivibrio ethanolgignens]
METGFTKKINVLYFSQVGWKWIKQRPHFMPEALAKQGCNVTFFALAIGKHKPVSIIENSFQVKEVKGVRGSEKYFVSRMLNRIICRKYLNDDFSETVDIVILTYPFQYDFLNENLKKKTIIYDCMDNIPLFYNGSVKSTMIRMEKTLCDKSEKIIVSSEKLKEVICKRYGINEEKMHVIRNALSKKILEKDYEVRNLQKNSIMQETIKCPNLVYVGTVGEWLDYELINKFAKENPNIYIYLVGPQSKEVKKLQRIFSDNVIFTGSKSHKEAMGYISLADIVILPFKVNELIECVDPVKMYEYIGLGKKVVSAYWKELDFYENITNVRFYKTVQEFDSLVKELFSDTRVLKADIDFVNRNNWDKRAEKLYRVICECREQ